MRVGPTVLVFSALSLGAVLARAQTTIQVPGQMGLQQAIGAVADGGVIEVAAGTYAAPANAFQIIDARKGFTIRGVGGPAVLSGGNANRILLFTNANASYGRPVVFENLTFANGYTTDAGSAGVTMSMAQATFVNCAFTGNNNNRNYAAGGAVSLANSTVFFIRSSFSNNRSRYAAGAMRIGPGASVFIHDSEFLTNRTNFPGHHASANGGAIQIHDATVRITNSRFVGNEAGYVGGAVYVIGDWDDPVTTPTARLTIANCYFAANKAKRDAGQSSTAPTEAGAVHGENQSTTRIYNSRFLGNLADNGGAVNLYRAEMEVYSSVFEGNTHPGTPNTPKFGGTFNAISNDASADGAINRRSAKLVIYDSFVQGRIPGQTVFPNSAGCVHVNGDQSRQYGLSGVPRIDDFTRNRATADIRRSVLYDCDVEGVGAIAGGIQAGLTSLTLADSIVTKSDGYWGGGLTVLIQSFVTVTNTTFSENAATWGGAIFAQGSTINASASRLVRNSVVSSGSGAAIRSAPDSVKNVGVNGHLSGNTIAENTGLPIADADQNSTTQYNDVKYDANAIQPSANAYADDVAPGYYRDVPGLNALTITRLPGPSTDKSPSSNNTAPSSAPVVGQIVAVPPGILGRGARNEAGPFPSHVGFAWGGAATATVNGVTKSGSGVVTADSPGLQTLQVSASTFTDSVAAAATPFVALGAAPGTVSPGGSSTLSWSASGSSVLEVGIDRGVGVTTAASGSAVVSPPATTTYRVVAVTPEGGAEWEATVFVGVPVIVVSPAEIPSGTVGVPYSRTFTQTGGSGAITWSVTGTLPSGLSLNTSSGVLLGTPTLAGSSWITVTATDATARQGSVTGALAIRRVAPFLPQALVVDPTGDGVLEPGETVGLVPSWENDTGSSATVTGAVGAFAGPGGGPYSIVDSAASYGTVAGGATASCSDGADCYSLTLAAPAARPAQHWDARIVEALSSGDAQHWLLHVGDSFADVPRTSGVYRYVETLLHNSVTGGCTASSYCPASPANRAQMAIFALVAKESPGYTPPACGMPVFNDVPASSPYCRWVEELARRGIVSGCGGGYYCPTSPITRGQMAIFMLKTLEPAVDPPACTTPVFADVPASSPYCRWIEELYRRGIVSGCGGGNYCPANAVTRGQMAVFITATFGLTLYGP